MFLNTIKTDPNCADCLTENSCNEECKPYFTNYNIDYCIGLFLSELIYVVLQQISFTYFKAARNLNFRSQVTDLAQIKLQREKANRVYSRINTAIIFAIIVVDAIMTVTIHLSKD